ncbi:hemerythrin domain-containing protein [Caenimonas koreensis]|uniref:hemerythrin domain-containing protein n=1 Tax=Caenimonas koreensis TaxID=367474 RepID=UPI003782F6CF
MFDPVKAWHEEHMYFGRLLALLQHEMDVFATGDTPNYALMLDIIEYLRDYADQYHHPREDAVFAKVLVKYPDRRLPLARLQQEHRVIAHAGISLQRMLEELQSDAVLSRSEVEVAAATYLVYYGNHIMREEEDILPLAAKALTAEDWSAAAAAAPGGEDPVFGKNPKARFHELRRRIALEAA